MMTMTGTETSLAGILALGILGIVYILLTPPDMHSQPVVLSVVGGIAGLGGYEIRKRGGQ
jgi:hypothetical protein